MEEIVIIEDVIEVTDVKRSGDTFTGGLKIIGGPTLPVEGSTSPALAVTAKLPQSEDLNLVVLLEHFKLPADVPDTKVSDLYLEAKDAPDFYSLDLKMTKWQAAGLLLKNTSVNVTYHENPQPPSDPQTKWTVSSSLELCSGVDTAVTGTVSDDSGWELASETTTGCPSTAELLEKLENGFGVKLPEKIASLFILKSLNVLIKLKTKQYRFGATGEFQIGKNGKLDMTMELDIAFDENTGTYSLTPVYQLFLHKVGFLVEPEKFENEEFTVTAPGPVKLADLIKEYGIPADFDWELQNVSLMVNTNPEKGMYLLTADTDDGDLATLIASQVVEGNVEKWAFVIALKLHVEFSLDELPLVGETLSASERLALTNLTVMVASEELTEQSVGHLNTYLEEERKLPAKGIKAGVSILSTLQIGTHEKLLIFLIGQSNALMENTLDVVKWEPVQASLGPLTFKRVGFRFKGNELYIMLDAVMKTGGLTVTLTGLAVSTPFKKFEPSYHLEGLGISYQGGPLEIGGNLLAYEEPSGEYRYDGMVVVKTQQYSFSGLASYTKVDGKPSMFVFVHVGGDFGGPPFFYVTGIAGGFGYNRELTIPKYDQVVEFPLMQVMDDEQPDAMKILANLQDGEWIEPKLGTDWLAVGVRFLTFAIMNSRVLAAANFGEEFTLSVLGVAQIRLPKEGDITLVNLELQLLAELKPQEGVFGIMGTLTENSYVLSKDCKASGTFAFYFWFDGPYKGDFVLTVGGYHASYRPPEHYPNVYQRLGLNWPMAGGVTAKGETYFAMTPACAMNGGRLEIRYGRGGIEAWFTAEYNLLLHWQPFHIEANIGVRIGVSGTIKIKALRIREQITVEVGASLYLWGPPFGGEVHIDCKVAKLTIPVGAGREEKKEKLLPEEFKKNMLPKHPVTLHAAEGLMREIPKQEREDFDTWVVRPGEFAFFSKTAIPATETQAMILTKDTPIKDGAGRRLNIRPTGDAGVPSKHVLTLESRHPLDEDLTDEPVWRVTAQISQLPEAVWGEPLGGNPGHASTTGLVDDQCTGLFVKIPVPNEAYGFDYVLDFEPLRKPGALPLLDTTPPELNITQHCSMSDVENTIMDQTVVKNRDQIYDVLCQLNVYQGANGRLDEMASDADAYLSEPPLSLQV